MLRPNPSSTSWMSEGFSFLAKGSKSFRAWLWALSRCLKHSFLPDCVCLAELSRVGFSRHQASSKKLSELQ